MTAKNISLRILQLVPAVILGFTSYGKLSSKPIEVFLFTELGMEPTGRYIIGVVEGLAAVFLLTDRLAATGGLLAIGTMCGALIAHLTILGFDLKHTLMLSSVLISAIIVTVARRENLPFIGKTLAG